MNPSLENNSNGKLLSTKEASELSGYHADYLARMCRAGKIPATRVGRSWLLSHDALEEFVKSQGDRRQELRDTLSRMREQEYHHAQTSLATAQRTISPLVVNVAKNIASSVSSNSVAAASSQNKPSSQQNPSADSYSPKTKNVFQQRQLALLASIIVMLGGVYVTQAAEVHAIVGETVALSYQASDGFHDIVGSALANVDQRENAIASVAQTSSVSANALTHSASSAQSSRSIAFVPASATLNVTRDLSPLAFSVPPSASFVPVRFSHNQSSSAPSSIALNSFAQTAAPNHYETSANQSSVNADAINASLDSRNTHTSSSNLLAATIASQHPGNPIAMLADTAEYAYASLGANIYNSIENMMGAYMQGIQASGNAALTLGTTIRDTGTNLPTALALAEVAPVLALAHGEQQLSDGILQAYANGVYAYVQASPEIPAGIIQGSYDTGSAIADAAGTVVPSLHTDSDIAVADWAGGTHAAAVGLAQNEIALGAGINNTVGTTEMQALGATARVAINAGYATGQALAFTHTSLSQVVGGVSPAVAQLPSASVLTQAAQAAQLAASAAAPIMRGAIDTSDALAAAVAAHPSYNTGEKIALFTYYTVNDLFGSTTEALALLFGGSHPYVAVAPSSSNAATSPSSLANATSSPSYVYNFNTYTSPTSAQPEISYPPVIQNISNGVTQAYVDDAISGLRTLMQHQVETAIESVGASTGSESGNSGSTGGEDIANSVTTQSLTVNGGSTFNGDVTITGTLTAPGFSGGSGTTSEAFFNATSSTATSTFQGNLVVNGTTNLGNLTFTNGTFTNATGTSLSLSSLNVTGTSTLGGLAIGSLNGFLKATSGAISTSLVDLTSDVTNVLPVANGGTGSSSFSTNGVIYGNGTGGLLTTGQGGTDTVLVANNGAPSFSSNITVTNVTTTATTTLATLGGSVGIGTTSPEATLGLQGGIGVNPFQLYLAANGAVGVGTSSPATSFAVNGNGYLTGGLGVGTINTTAGSIIATGNINVGSLTIGSLTGGILASNASSGLVYSAATSTATLGLGLSGSLTTLGAGQSLLIATSSLYSGNVGQFPYFSATNTLTATSSIFLSTAGYLGIGTTTPTNPLTLPAGSASVPALSFGDTGTGLYRNGTNAIEIVSNGQIVAAFGSGSSEYTNSVVNIASSNNASVSLANTGVTISRNTTDGNTALIVAQKNISSTGDILDLINSSATTTVFTNSGNLGLGTTSPLARLSVVGSTYLGGNLTATGTVQFTNLASGFLAVDTSGNVTSSTSLSVNYLNGVLPIAHGGTGLASTPAYGQILVGNSSNGYTLTATSSLGLATTFTSTYPIQYSSNVISLAFGTTTSNTWAATQTFTNSPVFSTLGAGTVNAAANGTLYSTATSSLALSGAFSYGGTLGSLIGGTGGTLSLAANGVALTNLAQIGANTVLVNNTSSSGNVTAIATSTFFGTGTGGQVLTWNNGVPQWVATTTYANGAGINTSFANGQLTISNTGVTSVAQAFGTAQTGALTFATTTNSATGLTTSLAITNSSGTFTFAPIISGTLNVANGGTGATTFTGGQLIYGSGTGALQSVATSSASLGLGLSGSLTAIGSGQSLSIATSSLYTGSTGQLAYFNGTNTLAATSSIFVSTAGNIGIGTSTPGVKLDINGSARIANTLTVSSIGICNGNEALQADASGDIVCGSISVSGASSGGGWTTNNAGSVTLSTTTDRVGIGATTTPYAKLSVISGSTSTTTLALVPVSGQTANIIDIYNTSGGLSSVFTSGGSLGLGTTSPATTLSVAGGTYINGGLGVGVVNNSAGTLVTTGNATIEGQLIPSTNSNTGGGTFEFGSNAWGGSTTGSASSDAVTGVMYTGGSGSQLFTFASDGSNNLSVQLDGTLFAGDTITYNPLSANATTAGDLVIENSGSFGGNLDVQGTANVGALSIGTLTGLLGVSSGSVVTATVNSPLSYTSNTLSLGTVGVTNGGTGSTTLGGILVGNGTSAVNALTLPSFLSLSGSTLSLGTLSVANGGTGSTTLTGLLKGNGTGGVQSAIAGTDYLAPSSLSATYPLQYSANNFSLAFGTSTSNTWGGTQTFTSTPVLGTLSGLVGSNNGVLYQIATSTNFVTSIAQSSGTAQKGAVTFATSSVGYQGITLGLAITNSGSTFTFAPQLSGNLAPAAGGTGSTTLSGILVGNGVGSVGSLSLPSFLALSGSTLSLNTLGVANGGTGWTNIQSGALIYGNGTNAVATTTAGTNGQVLALLNGVPTWTASTTFSNGLSYSGGNVTNTGVLALGPSGQTQTGTITIATSTSNSTGLTIADTVTGSAGTLTFAPSLSGTLNVANGGTGLASTPTYGQLLVGNGSGYTLTATSSLGLAPSFTASYPIQYTGNNLSLAFGTTTSNTWAGTQIFTNAPQLGTLTGLVGSNNGTLYQIATSSSFVTSLAAGSGISVSGSTGAVTIGNTGLLSLQQTFGSAQTGALTFATTSQTTNGQTIGLNITNSTGAFTFAPTISGTLTAAGGGTGISNPSAAGVLLGSYGGGSYQQLATSSLGLVTSVAASGGTTGLSFTGSPITTSGTLTLSGTLNVANGGTGSTTLGGLLKGNGTSAIQSAIAGTDYLAPSSLSATYPLQYSANNFSLAFGTTTSNTWAGMQTFSNAITVNGSTGTSTFAGQVAVNAGNEILFNGGTDMNWRIGKSLTAFTSALGLSTALDAVVGSGTNDGFAIGDTGGNSLFELKGSNNQAYFRGNVGIATTSNVDALDVSGTEYVSGALTAGSFVTAGNANVGSLTIGTLSGFLKANAGVIGTSQINLVSDVTGTLPVGNGGTGWNSIQSGAVLYGNGTSALATTSAGTAGQVLGFLNGIPTWTSTTTFSSGLSYSGGNVTNTGVLAIGPAGQTQNGTVSVATTTSTQNGVTHAVTVVGSGNTLTFTPSDSGTLTVAGGGTGATSFTAGNLIYGAGSGALQSVATGTISNGTNITVTGGTGASVVGGNITINLSGTVSVANGGTGSTTLSGILVGNGTSAVNALTLPSFLSLSGSTLALNGALGLTNGGTGTTTGGVTNGIEYYNGSTLTNGAGFVYNGGSIGIGTTSPVTTLSVAGNTYVTGGIGIGTVDTTAGSLVATGNANVGSLTIGTLSGVLKANAGVVGTGLVNLGSDVTSVLPIANGGTGTSTAPTYGKILVGDANGNYELQATSTLGLLSAAIQNLGPVGQTQNGSTVLIATSTTITNGLTSAITVIGSGNTLTFTPSLTGTLNVAGGGTGSTTLGGLLKGNGTSAIQSAIAGTDYLAPSSLSATYPILYSGNNFSLAFGTTTANSWSQLQQFNGNASSTQLTVTGTAYLATAGGSVGIGTTSPATTLAIAGSGYFTGGLGVGTVDTTAGSILATGNANVGSLTVGSLSGVLKANSGVVGTGLVSLTSDVTGTLPVANGGTGSTTLTGLLKGNGTGGVQSAIAGTDYLAPSSLSATYPLQYSANNFSLAFGTSTSNTWGGTQTFTSTPVLGTLSGLVGSNNGVLYQIATSTNFVTSALAGTGISVSGATGAVTISNTGLLSLAAGGASAQTGAITLATSTQTLNGITYADKITNSGTTFTFTPNISGTLNVVGGGTGLSSVGDGQIIYGGTSGSNSFVALATSTGGSILETSLTTGRPVWVATSTLGFLSSAIQNIGPAGQLQSGSTITIASSTSSFNGLTVGTTIVGSGNTLTLTPSLSGTLAVAGGGTGATSFTNGLVFGNGTNALTSVATSSVTNGTGITISGNAAVVGTGGLTITNTGVTSLAGTANQITASASTGDITLSLPSQLAIQNASTTNLSALTLAVGATGTTTISSTGALATPSLTIGALSGLLYGNSGAVSTATVSSPLSFSAGTLSLGTVGIANGGTGTTTGGVTNGVEYYNGSTLTNNSALAFNATNGTLTVNSAGGQPTIANTLQGNGVILQGASNGGTGQLRIVLNTGAWTDAATTTYFQITNSSNNNATFMGGTYGGDTQLNRLQFNASSTQFTDLAYGSTAIPGSLFSVQNGTASKRVFNIIGATSQAGDYLDITANGGSNGGVFSINSVGNESLAGTLAVSGTGTSTVSGGLSAANLADIALSSGLVKVGTGGYLQNAVSGTDYAPATSGTNLLYGNGSGGFSNATIGSGLSFTGGTLSTTGLAPAFTATYPVQYSSNVISLAFGTTTSNTWAGTQTFTNSPVFSSLTGGLVASNAASQGIYSTGTSTPLLGLGLSYSGTLGSFVGGTSGTLTIATSSLYIGGTGQVAYFNGTNSLTGTSTITIGSNGNVGIGSTTPTDALSVAGNIWVDGTGGTMSVIGVPLTTTGTVQTPGTVGLNVGTTTTGSNGILALSGVALYNGTVSNNIQGINGAAILGSGATTNITSAQNRFFAENESTGYNITTMSALTTNIRLTGTLSSSTNATNFVGETPTINSGNTITNFRDFWAQAPSISGTITNEAGLDIESLTAATNNTEVLLGTSTIPTGNFGIYQADTNTNYLAGNLGIGSTTPGSILSIGTTNGINFSTATSTFSSTGGINLTSGCFAVNGVCVGGSVGGSSFGQTLSIDTSNWISATTTNRYGINASASGLTYGFGIGDQLFAYASSTNGNVVLGLNAGGTGATTTATLSGNTAIGNGALESNTSSNYNTAVGYQALQDFVGSAAGNNAIGAQALQLDTTGAQNTAEGRGAMALFNTTGSKNNAIGSFALQYVNGTNDTANGYGAGSGTGGFTNQGGVYMGYESGFDSATSSDYNTLVGYQAGYNNTFGFDNLLLGATPNTGGNEITTGGNNIGLGFNVAFPSATASNQLNIGNTIFGTITATSTSTSVPTNFLGDLIGIASTTPWARFSIDSSNIGSAPAFAVGSSTSTSLIVANNGFVGIGTTSPAFNLSVVGLTRVKEKTDTTNAFDVENAAGTTTLEVDTLNSSNGIFSVATSTGTTYFTVGSSGNVGIGTTSPYAALSVFGGGDYGAHAASTLFAIGSTTHGTATTTLFSILSGGNVGIGTTSPTATLGIQGSIGVSNSQLYLASNGFVGIGTTSPASALAVSAPSSSSGQTIATFGTSGFGATMSIYQQRNTPDALQIRDVATGLNVVSDNAPSTYIGLGTGALGLGEGSAIDTYTSTGIVIDPTNVHFGYGLSGNENNLSLSLSGGSGSQNSQSATFNFETNTVASTTANPSLNIGAKNINFLVGGFNGTYNQAGMFAVNGDFGVGTTSPSATLSVSATTSSSVLTPLLAVASSTNATLFDVMNNGNVGIGTTTPDNLLDVTSQTGAAAASIDGHSANATLALKNSGALEWQILNVAGSSNQFNITNGTSGVKLNQGDTVWSSVSDERLKTNVQDVSVLDKLADFQAVTYNWKPGLGMSTTTQLGVLAQQLYPLFPEAVNVGSDDPNEIPSFSSPDTWSVKYELLAPIALEGVKELADGYTLENPDTGATSTIASSYAGTNAPAITVDPSGNVAVGQTGISRNFVVSGNVSASSYEVNGVGSSLVNSFGSLALSSSSISSVLSADGSGVDLYKLATFTLSNVQQLAAQTASLQSQTSALASTTNALSSQVGSLTARVSALEAAAVAGLADATSTANTSTLSATTTQIVDALQSVGVLIQNGIAQFNTLVVRDLVFSKDSDGSSAAGSATIVTGNTVLEIENSHMLPTSQVSITPTSPISGNWYISQKQNGSFTVTLSQPQASDFNFDYLIVQTQGQIATSTPTGYEGTPFSWINALFGNATNTQPQPQQQQAQPTQPTNDTSSSTTGNTDASTTASSTPATASSTPSTASSTPAAAPTVTLNGAAAISLTQGDIFTDPGATAKDASGNDISSSITETGSVDTNTVGIYTLTYTATDSSGATGSASRVVTITASYTSTDSGSIGTSTPSSSTPDSSSGSDDSGSSGQSTASSTGSGS